MDRRLARRNMFMGIAMFVTLIGLLAFCFVWATIYLSAIK